MYSPGYFFMLQFILFSRMILMCVAFVITLLMQASLLNIKMMIK